MEIKEVFKVSGVGKVAGCIVTEGVARRSAGVRLLRDNVVIHEGTLKTLKRFNDELRVSHEQNVILPHVHMADLPQIHAELKKAGLATANIGLVSDIIACPGMDYCALATARSIKIRRIIRQ